MLLTEREQQVLDCCLKHINLIDEQEQLSYFSSVAVYEFLGGVKQGYYLKKTINGAAKDRYWLVNSYGAIIDPARTILADNPAYRYGQKAIKHNNLKKHLPLLQQMRDELGELKDTLPTHDIVGRQLVLAKDAALSDEQSELLNNAWRVLFKEWGEQPDKFIKTHFTKGALAVRFVRSLLYGEDIPRFATMAYTSERFFVPGSARSYNDVLLAALESPQILRGLRFVLIEEPSFSKLVATANLPIGGHRMPLDFPISLARDLINKYCLEQGVVLDPCHGWGGRLVGFMLSKADAYVGIDPAPHSYKLQEMFTDLNTLLPVAKYAKFINKPFEDTKLAADFYDFALTSPPYYNTEKYDGVDSSWRRYKTLDQWIEGFYKHLITGVALALKPGGRFCLQITTKFKMVEVAKQISQTIGLEFEQVVDTGMRRYNSSAEKSDITDLFEVFIVFRKLGA